MKDGTKLIYLHEDAGRVTDTGVYLAPGAENVVVVGQDLNGELAQAFVERGICAVHAPEADDQVALDGGSDAGEVLPEKEALPEMPWLNSAGK